MLESRGLGLLDHAVPTAPARDVPMAEVSCAWPLPVVDHPRLASHATAEPVTGSHVDASRTGGAEDDAEGGPECGVRMFGQAFARGSTACILAAAAAAPANGPRLVVTANVDHIVLLAENAAFRKAYAGAAARTLDGTPLVWLARLRGQPVARVTGHDLIASALFGDPPGAKRIFLVCSMEKVADAIRKRLVASGFADAAIATCVPPFGFDDDAAYGDGLAARIRDHGTTLLVMGVGAPRSEVWVDRQGVALGTPIVLAVGDAVSVAAGLVPRAPVLLQRVGLEWAFRFACAPRRLFHRYFVRSWRFLALLRREMIRRDTAS